MQANDSRDPSASGIRATSQPHDAMIAATEDMEISRQQVKTCLHDSDALKQEATTYFRESDWEQALAKYSSALGVLPKRIEEPKSETSEGSGKAAAEQQESNSEEDGHQLEETEIPSPDEKIAGGSDSDIATARSILNANIGACYVKLGEYKEAAQFCTEALRDNPKYVKALQRRAMCNEKIATWSTLASAEEDYNVLLNILPQDSPLISSTRRSLDALKPRLEEAKQKETGEMLDKLKGLGNQILGNFGLSTDNFKFDPDGKGGYSLNFSR